MEAGENQQRFENILLDNTRADQKVLEYLSRNKNNYRYRILASGYV